MKVNVNVAVNAARERIWQVITDLENSPNTISGINKIEILDQPESGLVGLKWRETRTMFGKEATEVMWITEAVDNEYYLTRAESHGSIYVTKMAIEKQNDTTILSMEFDGQPQTLSARIMWALTGFMFKSATKKALLQDLNDIKAAAEG